MKHNLRKVDIDAWLRYGGTTMLAIWMLRVFTGVINVSCG